MHALINGHPIVYAILQTAKINLRNNTNANVYLSVWFKKSTNIIINIVIMFIIGLLI